MTKTFGYSRMSSTSTPDEVETERRRLIAAGCVPDLIFVESLSVSAQARPVLLDLLTHLARGDQLVVPSFRRLARDLKDLAVLLNDLHSRGVVLRELDWGIDTATEEGRLFVTHLAPLVSFESQLRLERQREGIARAKAAGSVLGRSATARQKTDEVVAMRGRGETISQIASSLSIGEASVSRILKAVRESRSAPIDATPSDKIPIHSKPKPNRR